MNEHKHHEVLWNLIKETRFCMLSHRHDDGSLHAHPLTMQNRSLDEHQPCIYFFVSRKTEVGQRLRRDGNVNLSFANVKEDSWVSITGTAIVREDARKKKELFDLMDKVWFDGPDDPEMELVEVRVNGAEYWNVRESKLLQLLKMGKAAAGGTRPHLGEHQELHYNS